jgi:hypothetical protein
MIKYLHICKLISYICIMQETDWNEKAKRLLKSELIRRGISTEDLVGLLSNIGVDETKASIDSKISRGTFSAAFLIQCLNAIGCRSFLPEIELNMVSESIVMYKSKKVASEK